MSSHRFSRNNPQISLPTSHTRRQESFPDGPIDRRAGKGSRPHNISLPIILLILLVLLLLSCGDEDIVNPPQDRVAPATTTDLAIDSLSSGSMRLHWTAPGDDSVSGQASKYDIRYSTTELDSSTWDYGTSCTNPHTPSIAGTVESFIVTDLEPMTKYYFALRTSDESHNWSDVSNVVSAKTPDSIIITWERTYGGQGWEFLTDVAVALDGGYVMAGRTESYGAGWGDAFLVKVDEYGNQLWQQTYGGRLAEMANAVDVTPDGGYILAGWAGFTDIADDTLDAYIVKTDGTGNVIWEKVFGKEDQHFASGISAVSGGGYIVSGHSHTYYQPEGAFWLLRLDEGGNFIWEHKYGEHISDIAYSVVPSSDGDFVAAGIFDDNTVMQAYLMKIDSDGNATWGEVIGSELRVSMIRSVIVNDRGNYVVGGYAGVYDPTDVSTADAYLAEIDQTGNTLWQHTFGGDSLDYFWSVAAADDGGYVAAGATWSYGAGRNDVYIIKVDGSGNLIWERVHGGPLNEYAESIAATPDGGYIVGGGSTAHDFYLLKVDAYGNL